MILIRIFYKLRNMFFFKRVSNTLNYWLNKKRIIFWKIYRIMIIIEYNVEYIEWWSNYYMYISWTIDEIIRLIRFLDKFILLYDNGTYFNIKNSTFVSFYKIAYLLITVEHSIRK